MKSRLYSALILWCGLLAAPFVSAHSPFLVPTSFTPAHEHWVSLDAGFAEVFFQSDVAFDKGNFQVLTPAGQWQAPGRYEQFKTRSLVEHQLVEKGTYRFTTGQRLGAVFRFYELDGARKATRDPKEVLPKGAKLLDHYQSLTLAETYVSSDKPTSAALKAYDKGLELVAINHPNDLYAGDALKLRVLLDGKPLVAKDVSLFATQYGDDSEKPTATLPTNAQGEVEFSALKQGVHVLHVRHTAPAPKTAEAPNYGYVYTLTFAVNAPL